MRLTRAELVMSLLVLVALVRLAPVGVVPGTLLDSESTGPAPGRTTSILAPIRGTFIPRDSGIVHDVIESVVLAVQASHVALRRSVPATCDGRPGQGGKVFPHS
jgi:hypothetical protein